MRHITATLLVGAMVMAAVPAFARGWQGGGYGGYGGHSNFGDRSSQSWGHNGGRSDGRDTRMGYNDHGMRGGFGGGDRFGR